MLKNRRWLVLLFFLVLYGGNVAIADDYDSRQQRTELVQKGIQYLVENQKQAGYWHMPLEEYEDGVWGNWGRENHDTSVTALAALALLGLGNTPTRGLHHAAVDKAALYLLSHQREDGLISNDDALPMYGHGYAALFLSQLYGMTPFDDKIKKALQKSVQLIARSQTVNGGWYYAPRPVGGVDLHEDDGSLTIVQIQALRGCRDAGISVPKRTIKMALNYIKASQNKNGRIEYDIHGKTAVSPALTIAGMAVLFYAGLSDFENEDKTELENIRNKGFDYLDRLEKSGNLNIFDPRQYRTFFMYTHFYAVQAYKQRSPKHFEPYFKNIQDTLIKTAKDGGSSRLYYSVPEEDRSDRVYWDLGVAGKNYSTAIALIILESPLDYLPIFEK